MISGIKKTLRSVGARRADHSDHDAWVNLVALSIRPKLKSSLNLSEQDLDRKAGFAEWRTIDDHRVLVGVVLRPFVIREDAQSRGQFLDVVFVASGCAGFPFCPIRVCSM